MSGYLRLNGVTGKYDFVFTDPVDFDTAPNQTATDNSPAQLTIKVGDTAYTQPNPGGGLSGFHVSSWTRTRSKREIRASIRRTPPTARSSPPRSSDWGAS